MTDDQSTEILYRCTIDEAEQNYVQIADKAGAILARDINSLARGVIDARELLTLGLYPVILRKEFADPLCLLAYACEHPTRRKKRTPMDVDEMVEKWIPLIRELAVAHDIDKKDAASAALDDHLLPVIAAPVAQIREFYRKLTAELKADETIPWAVWKLFDFWGENVLDKVGAEQELQLKTEIAKRIAENSMALISREDWLNSMIGALQWRSPEKLAQIETKLEEGHKPKIKGRESCLFLVVDECEVML